MSDSKGITTKATIIIVACVIVVGLGGYFGWKIYKERTGPIDRVNPNIPSDLLFQSKSDELPEGHLLVQNVKLDTDLIYSKEDVINALSRKGKLKLYCKPSNREAERVEYFYYFDPARFGAWGFRYAYICEEKYWILNGTDMSGIRIFGPFKRGKEPISF